MYKTAHANPASEWGNLATLARRMHMCKSLMRHGAFIGILHAHRENVHTNFHCSVFVTLIFCYKITSIALVSLANQPFFFVTRTYVQVRLDVREALAVVLVKYPLQMETIHKSCMIYFLESKIILQYDRRTSH